MFFLSLYLKDVFFLHGDLHLRVQRFQFRLQDRYVPFVIEFSSSCVILYVDYVSGH